MSKTPPMAFIELELVPSGSGFVVRYYNGATGTRLEPYFATRKEAEKVFLELHEVFSHVATAVEVL